MSDSSLPTNSPQQVYNADNSVVTPFQAAREIEHPEREHQEAFNPERATYRSPSQRDDPLEQTVFLGESSPLTCVIDEGRRSPARGYACQFQKTRLQYSIPEAFHTAPSTARNKDACLHIHKNKMEERLSREGAFSFPTPPICSSLLQAYFTWFQPCFPVLDRAVVSKAYTSRAISPLLLQAMLFIGVSLCTDSVFSTTGFEDRFQAKFLFYSRAKEIYDADWESDTIVKIQSLFLLSFWRGRPSDERDTRFWLGVAISLAQKRGMHAL
jgi:hypothetical protein